jgi:hypothetical protein
MSGGTVDWEDTSRETALAVIPKNELAIVAAREGAGADRLDKVGFCLGVGGVFGLGVLTVVGAIVAAPALVPVVGIAGVASIAMSGVAGIVCSSKGEKARKRQYEASEKRTGLLRKTAQTALADSINVGTICVGLDIRIEPQDETPKKVRVEDMKTIIDADGSKKLSISARILEADGTGIDWLGESVVEMEQGVAAFPKAVAESMRAALAEDQNPVAVDAPAPEPRSLPDQSPDKILPRITPIDVPSR